MVEALRHVIHFIMFPHMRVIWDMSVNAAQTLLNLTLNILHFEMRGKEDLNL